VSDPNTEVTYMILIRAALAGVAAAGVVLGGAMGLATASADPVPPPPGPPVPPNAPKKPAETWQGHPMVWAQLPAGGHWGVWINGDFLPFS